MKKYYLFCHPEQREGSHETDGDPSSQAPQDDSFKLIAGMTALVLVLVLLFPAAAKAEKYAAVCQLLTNHQPRADVMHQGNADINAPPFQVPEIVKVPLDVELAKGVAGLMGKNLQLDAPIGMIEIHQDGSVRYGDQDWTAPVMTLCGKSHMVVEAMEVKAIEVKTDQPILNSAQILNQGPIINRAPSAAIAEIVEAPQPSQPPVQEDSRLDNTETIKSAKPAQLVSKAKDGLIEVKPAQAIPPIDVKPAAEEKVEVSIKEPEIIEGGDYREIFYNE